MHYSHQTQETFDLTIGQCLVSDENNVCKTPIRHNTLSDDDVRVGLSYDGARCWKEAFTPQRFGKRSGR